MGKLNWQTIVHWAAPLWRSAPWPAPYRQLLWGCLAIPPVVLLVCILRFHVDLPFWDQWELVPLLDKYYKGKLGFRHLFAQHNEHRLLIPKSVLLFLAVKTGWQPIWPVLLSWVAGLGIFGAIAVMIRRIPPPLASATTVIALLVASVLVFSLRQYENWSWGWQLQVFLNVLGVVWGMAMLTRSRLTPLDLVAAILAGLLATFSFGNGLLFWPVGGLVLILRRARWSHLVWWPASGLVYWWYFRGFRSQTQHPAWDAFLNEPLIYLQYVLNFIGNPVNPKIAGVCTVLGLVLFGVLLRQLCRQDRRTLRLVLPFVALALYAFGSAAITGVARVGFGSLQALSSRYASFAILFWVGLVGLGYLRWAQLLATQSPSAFLIPWGRLKPLARAGLVAALLLVVSTVATSTASVTSFKQRYNHIHEAQGALINDLSDKKALKKLYPNPKTVRRYVNVLRRHCLSVYRNRLPACQKANQPIK